ncbi:MAG: 50S ribosomal protein L11 methyltransferase [Lentisphaeria bacterium]|jgi:ribosomal protein L11 methyltransferase|nr:50S ribosomal protein L11 methyltransferase [Lentisphaeria bacterium]MDY0175263.1 50S ribosomal protein L11 methyltransferase [Lentisphaeria bacterium]NLZ60765.1 50S ribosomal protein L11 methyltransferase [Lentisphaerota bacterium]
MNDTTLHFVEIVSAPDVAAPLEELLCALELSSSSYSDLESGKASILLHCASASEAELLAQELRRQLPQWRALLGKPVLSLAPIVMHAEDWAESWKRHFHCFKASERIVVKPSWESYCAKPGELLLELDPGMCFGTGYHGTTKACLQFLDQIQAELGEGQSFLEAGCGSGILSIAAKLLGYEPVFAFDHDPQAVDCARQNLLAAGHADVQPELADVQDYSPAQPCRVVAANILAPVLIEYAENIVGYVAKSRNPAYLILSGILHEQYEAVKQRYVALGLQEVNKICLDEWSSGRFLLN